MRLVVATDPTRDHVFVEIQNDGQPWAEVIFDEASGRYMLTVFGGAEGRWPVFGLSEAVGMLDAARRELGECPERS